MIVLQLSILGHSSQVELINLDLYSFLPSLASGSISSHCIDSSLIQGKDPFCLPYELNSRKLTHCLKKNASSSTPFITREDKANGSSLSSIQQINKVESKRLNILLSSLLMDLNFLILFICTTLR